MVPAMMLQPFQYNIEKKGEISMMIFNGIFTIQDIMQPTELFRILLVIICCQIAIERVSQSLIAIENF